MKRTIVTVLTLCCLWAAPASVSAQEGADADEMAEMMAQMAKFTSPGEHHELLKIFVGDWDASVKIWMHPKAPPTESQSTAHFEMMFGDRWLRQEWTGEFMGQPMMGFGISGYDVYEEEYVSVWVDNMNTSMSVSYGQYDAETRTFTFTGTMDEPMLNQRDKPMTFVYAFSDDDHFVFDMQEKLPDGTIMTPVQISYTRKK